MSFQLIVSVFVWMALTWVQSIGSVLAWMRPAVVTRPVTCVQSIVSVFVLIAAMFPTPISARTAAAEASALAAASWAASAAALAAVTSVQRIVSVFALIPVTSAQAIVSVAVLMAVTWGQFIGSVLAWM